MSSEIDTKSSKPPEKDTDLGKVAASSDDPNPSQGQSDMYSSTKTSTHVDVNRATNPAPNHPKASIENESIEGKEKRDIDDGEDEVEEDSEEDFPEYDGGEPRGRVVHPVAGTKTKPVRPK